MSACFDTGCILDNGHGGKHRNTSGSLWGEEPSRALPIQDAIKAVNINLAWCDAATPGPWDADTSDPSDVMVWSSELASPLSPDADADSRAVFQLGAWMVATNGDDPKDANNARFIVTARAGYKAALEYLLFALTEVFCDRDTVAPDWPITAAVRPLIEHLDATRPNWRTE